MKTPQVSRPMLLSLVAALGLAWAPGCKQEDDDKDEGNTTNSAWLVGEQGAMFRLDDEGDVETYPLRTDVGLSAIICHGSATAWVVGDDGTVMVTRDEGVSWTTIVVDAQGSDLTAVAAADAHAEGLETVFAVGSRGAVLRSVDGGANFSRLSGADGVDFTGVGIDAAGATALATGIDGSIWRSTDGGPLAQVFAQPGEVLHAITGLHSDGGVTAVGDDGLIVVSSDGGTTWTTTLVPTTRDLFAVRTVGDNETVAVGEAGVVVKLGQNGVTAEEFLDPALALHGLHLGAGGTGQTVGDAGVVLLTNDLGLTWTPVELGHDVPLRGVDDFRTHHH